MQRGYTLIELLVVLAILGVLSAMAMPLADMVVQRDKERELKRALWEIRDAIDAYHRLKAQGMVPGADAAITYPPSLATLVRIEADGASHAPRLLRRIPRDPFADPALPAEKTWGLRSYESEADSPRPGSNVYDVYSMSTKVGMNGVPLRQW